MCHVLKRTKDDLISKLPDDILISIISRLSTKVATRTSLLSRRWRNLYRYVPNIDFYCFDHFKHGPISYGIRKSTLSQNSELVMNALDSLLRIRSGSKIRSFRLTGCLNKSVTDRFEQCISSLGRLGVEKLSLQCWCFRDVFCSSQYISDLSFSCCLFPKLPSLKAFKLSMCHLQPSLGSQSNNNSLQKIVLMDVKVSPGAIECVLSNCLKLHSLTMTSCKCPSKLSFCGSHLELKSLYIKECEGVEEIEFHASNLVVFDFWSRKLVNLKFDHVPRLQSTYICIYEKNILPYVCGKLAMDLPGLKSLHFVTKGDTFQESRINMFGNLRRLYIHVYSLPQSHLLSLTSFLHSCPLLQVFHLNVIHNQENICDCWRRNGEKDIVEIELCDNGSPVEKQAVEKHAVVFHSELKKMLLGGFSGTKDEIEFALYILKSAISLENMHISKSFKVYDGPRDWSRAPVCPWTEKERARIHSRLQGQAVSKTAQLSIQYKPIFDEDC